jgi:Fe-S oxidoreductase
MNTFKNQYAGLKNTVETEHYIELLDRLIATGRIKPVGMVDITVTYHDPCYLGRHNGIYDAPRRVLNSIPKLRLVEMENNRERSLCCGGGGGGLWKEYPRDQRFGVVRVRQAIKTGADVIATACPYCIRMLNEAITELNVENKIQVQDISELVLTSVEFSNDTKKSHTHITSLEQEDCHV